ncbi:MAG: hypothetical protein NZ455_13260 [Bacteroidia bacterium]|nr:hypothetical protein [Bacteroidia bacterium]
MSKNEFYCGVYLMKKDFIFWACPSLRSGRCIPHYATASVLRCASYCPDGHAPCPSRI